MQTRIPVAVLDRLRDRSAATRIAVVGASNNPSKYGNIIVQDLDRKGYTVLPVNPREPEVAGLKAWPDVASVPGPIHILDFVTPPEVTYRVLEALDPATADALWFQDGSFDARVLAFARERFPQLVHDACIMVASRTV
jgi:predicted CoA-binding protein